MLRHMKKHSGRSHNGDLGGQSDCSDDEQTATPPSTPTPTPMIMPQANNNNNNNNNTCHNNNNNNSKQSLRLPKLHELLDKANEWRVSRLGEHKENIAETATPSAATAAAAAAAAAAAVASGDLIGNLLGISDQGILNKLLSSADEAAKLLGVDK